jgi:serine/threonine-protein kinase
MTSDDEDSSDDPFLEEVARISEVSGSSTPEAARPDGSRIGKFVLRGELGRGGMGIVYRASDEQLGRAVALKVLREQTRSDPQRRARFLREARSSAALVHRNVATVYEVGEADGELYIAMELVAGESLRQRMVASGGALPVEQAVAVARGIARALGAAHAKGIIHRDLKPENVMLDAEGEPKVLDFGLAKVHQSVPTPQDVLEVQPTEGLSTAEGRVLGTPAYMSPEQAQGKPVDLRTDVFSFGIVLFEMLAGERPFKGDSGMDLAIAIARDPPLDLQRVKPAAPRWLAGIVGVCLAKAPAERYASAHELGVALESAPSVAEVPVARIGIGRLVVFALVAALVVVAGFAFRARRREAPPLQARGVLDAGAAAPRSLTAYPRPVTKSAEAGDAYATAMQDLRDAYIAGARLELRRAVKLDRTFAAAHLRLLSPWFQNEDSSVEAREHYALAQEFRTSLDARDRALLEVAEACTHDPIDWDEAARRLRKVLERFPDDVEVLADLAEALIDAGQVEEGRAMAERALSIDPEFAYMEYVLAQSRHYGASVVPIDLLERCVALSPRAVSCLQLRAIFEREKGRCADYERTARSILAMAPQGITGHMMLADALAVRGAPLEGVRALLDSASALRAEQNLQSAAENEEQTAIALGLLAADFPRVIAAASDRDRRHSTSTSEHDHAETALTIITSLIEEGRDGDAVRAAEDFEKRTPAWSLNDDRVREYLLYARHHAGHIDDAAFRDAVEAFERADEAQHVAQERPVSAFWADTAFATESPLDLDIARPYLDQPQFSGHLEATRGHLLFLAGRPDEALPVLRAGASTCEILPTGTGDGWQGLQAFTFMHSHLWLAEALEAKGDTAGACANYAVVTDRWKNAKPRSVTLEKAKARSRALHCAAN